MHQSVILIHTLPDGTSHFDWLIDQPNLQADHRLISFRCSIRPDQTNAQSFTATAIPLHRAQYLTYEGTISQNRGSVKQAAVGTVEYLAANQHEIQLRIQWHNPAIHSTIHYSGKSQSPIDPTSWIFHAQPTKNQLDEPI